MLPAVLEETVRTPRFPPAVDSLPIAGVLGRPRVGHDEFARKGGACSRKHHRFPFRSRPQTRTNTAMATDALFAHVSTDTFLADVRRDVDIDRLAGIVADV